MAATVAANTAARLDQSITDFKTFVAQRFSDQDRMTAEWRKADQRLLDERFKTQTTTLDAAFAAAEKGRQEALRASNDQRGRLESRLKVIEDRINTGDGTAVGKREMWSYLVGAVGAVGMAAGVLINVLH